MAVARFIESLSAKVHDTPPSIEKLTNIFQEFYPKAEKSIATHISALSTRQAQGSSLNSSPSSKRSRIAIEGKTPQSPSSKKGPRSTSLGLEQQMLTPLEISDRRKARRFLDRKKVALEEAVERKVCERTYDRIWRHRSTLDEVRDEKLRSRTAALALVGIGLQDLGISFDALRSIAGDSSVEDWISKARDGLLRMNDAKYPLGKLQQLAAAHKSIVDLLTALHQSSSSADEILPTLIYTLITSPPEGINVISNLHFIQRFRALSRIDGEAAYCLVNLEAAITFLETVDLASLRSGESPRELSASMSRPATPLDEDGSKRPQPKLTVGLNTLSPDAVASKRATSDHSSRSASPPTQVAPAPPAHHGTLSNLFQPPASAIGAAGDAMRITAIKTISNTLDTSFNLLFGRLHEHKLGGDALNADGTIVAPKTLEDARKLVDPTVEEEDESSTSAAPVANQSDDNIASSAMSDDSLLSAFAGRKPSRDRSVDSAQSSGSGKKVAFASENNNPSTTSTMSSQSGNAAAESKLTFGNSLNPLKGFSGFGFGRTSSGSPSSSATPSQTSMATAEKLKDTKDGGETTATKIQPPSQRFLDVRSAEELKLGEIEDLLIDYKRLSAALKDLQAF